MSNGGKVKYGYDEFDRLTKVCYDNANIDSNPRFTYEYGANGGVVQVTDHASGKVASTEYDLANRPMQMTIRDSAGDVEYRTTLKYDEQSRLSCFSENVGGQPVQHDQFFDMRWSSQPPCFVFEGAF